MTRASADADAYWPLLRKHWDILTGMYMMFEDRAPIMEYDVVAQQIRAWPAQDYIRGLSLRTRERTRKQYERVAAEGGLIVFVNDASKRILRSYVFDAVKRPSSRSRSKKSAAGAIKPHRGRRGQRRPLP